jgi:hypothetical protein
MFPIALHAVSLKRNRLKGVNFSISIKDAVARIVSGTGPIGWEIHFEMAIRSNGLDDVICFMDVGDIQLKMISELYPQKRLESKLHES